MWRLWILLCSAFLAESENIDYIEVLFGKQLSISIPSVRSDSLEFTSADETQHYTVWSKFIIKRGSVIGVGDDRRFVISSVNFDDQGTYTQKNFWNKVTATTKLKVLPKRASRDCVAGETLRIYLDGIRKDEASLWFSREGENLMLVNRGSSLRDRPDYNGRVKVGSSSIEVLNVNVTDEGNYTLFDGKNRKAVTIRMFIVDHHPPNHSPFMALLLLLGIPVGVCCCCRKRICKKNSQGTATTTVQSNNVEMPPGPPPAYNTPMVPAGPVPIYTPGYPAPGESQVHPPPPNPAYPVQPQYGGQPAMPPNPMYTPGYPAPGDSHVHPPPANPAYPPLPQYGGQPAMPPNPGFTPVMYNAPAGSETAGIKMSEPSPAAPLLGPSQTEVGPPQAPYPGTDVLNSSNPTVQFNSSNYNFL